MLFLTYIHDRLGLEALQAFAAHPARGLAGLDAALAELGFGMDADSFFADWVLANYLQDRQLGDGRYGYMLLESLPVRMPPSIGDITHLPTQIQESVPQYATDYYEIALPTDDLNQTLELQLSFPNSAAQDGLVAAGAGDRRRSQLAALPRQ